MPSGPQCLKKGDRVQPVFSSLDFGLIVLKTQLAEALIITRAGIPIL